MMEGMATSKGPHKQGQNSAKRDRNGIPAAPASDRGNREDSGQAGKAPVNSRERFQRITAAIGKAILRLTVRWAARAQAASPRGPWIQK